MTNAYCNMSAPPRSRVHKEVRPIGSHIVFDLDVLSGLSERPCDNELTCWLRKFENQILTVAVLGRLAGGIYIPHRKLGFAQATTQNRFAFPESAFTGRKGTQP